LTIEWLYRLRPSVVYAVSIVPPQTVVRWRRVGFRLYWRLKVRQRRVILLRRRLVAVMLTEQRSAGGQRLAGAPSAQLRLGFVELDARQDAWEYAVLVTSLEADLLTIAQLYRDRGNAENNFDELKNQWAGAASPPMT
jgi:hypothetical protein